VLMAHLLSANDTIILSRRLPFGGGDQCIRNLATNQSYRLQLIAYGYIASPSHVEWAEIHQVSLLESNNMRGMK
jgi:hypothetical protein